MERLPARYSFTLFSVLLFISSCTKRMALSSPSGHLTASVYAGAKARLTWDVRLDGKPVIAPSPAGITVDHLDLGQGVELGAPVLSMVDNSYPWEGVHKTAINHYRQALIPIMHRASGRHYLLEARSFNDGFAFRYIVPAQNTSLVSGEATAWNIPGNSTVWYQENIYYYEGLYYAGSLAALGTKHLGPPVTYRTPEGLYGSITEAALYNYSGMSLRSDSTDFLYADFVNDPLGWSVRDTIVTPWRVVLASADLNGLVNADIIHDLNPAADSALAEAGWIKPGRAVWSYFVHDNVSSASIERAYIDKAFRLGFEYSVVDAGWDAAWPSKWDTLQQLVNYGRDRKVGIWVWKSYPSLKDDATRIEFFRTLSRVGVVGVKIDYVDKEGKEQVDFYENALKDAARFHLLIDFHGSNKPTGYERRFPNELTREAIYGQEWRTFTPQGPANNTTLPFTRFLAGPGDYTPGVFTSTLAYGTSRAHQLALPVIYNSPLMCWADDPDTYLGSPALDIIRSMPTVWDETIVLPSSKIGETAAFARRKNNDWFIGIIHAGKECRFSIPLSFLGPGHFDTQIVRDDLENADGLLYSRTGQEASDSLSVVMRTDGGYTAFFRRTEIPAPALNILPAGGYLDAPVRVSISLESKSPAQDPVAKPMIRYTLDGSLPDKGSSLYTQAFIVDHPLLVRARAFSEAGPMAASAIAQFLSYPAPIVSPEEGMYIGSLPVTITPARPFGLEGRSGSIRYTLDGSDPLIDSPAYKDTLVLHNSVQLKSRLFFESGTKSALSTITFSKTLPSPAVNGISVKPGLHYYYYEGNWLHMPDLKGVAPHKEGVVALPGLESVSPREDYYAIDFSGYIDIPQTGVYTFYTLSDDGSLLFVDGVKLVDNDGCHGDLEKEGQMALAAGKHIFNVRYFENASGQTLKVAIKGPGLPKQEIPASLFFH